MEETGAKEHVPAILFRDRNVDNRVQSKVESVTRRARGLRQLQSGVTERHVRIEKIAPQPKIFVRIAGHTEGSYKASASDKTFCRPAVHMGSGAHVKVPVFVVVSPLSPRRRFFLCRFPVAGRRLRGRGLGRGALLSWRRGSLR